MLLLKYLLLFAGAGLFTGAAAILIWDLYQIFKSRKTPAPKSAEGEPALPGPLERGEWDAPPAPIRWHLARRMALVGIGPWLIGLSIAMVPSGSAGVRVNQFVGTRPSTLYPGVHFVLPLIEDLETFSVRDNVFATVVDPDPKKSETTLSVQTREGLTVGMAVAVRYRLNAERLAYVQSNLPQPLEDQVIAPTIASVFRDLAPAYIVREMFATKREEVRAAAAARITEKLAADGISVKEVMLRDVQLPADYAKGLEGLLLKEQENERLVGTCCR